MIINLKKNLHWLVYGVGLAAYFIFLMQTTLTLSIIWLIFILYAWILLSLLLQEYYFKHFLYVLCTSGILIAISIFFINGIEELALPKGAILFKIEGIAQALFLFFVFSVPLLIYPTSGKRGFFADTMQNTTTLEAQTGKPQTPISHAIESEEWEEATIEDLESGTYEPI